jgi:Uma2 family endonuclease
MDHGTSRLRHAQLAALRAIREAEDFPESVWCESTPDHIVFLPYSDYEHAVIRSRIGKLLTAARPALTVMSGVAFMTAAHSERTPDLFVQDPALRPDFRDGHVMSLDGVHLLLEVTSDATHATDVNDKPLEYAMSGVAVYLIVDRNVPQVVVHHGPTANGYAHTDRYQVGADVVLPSPIDVTLDMAFLPGYLDRRP